MAGVLWANKKKVIGGGIAAIFLIRASLRSPPEDFVSAEEYFKLKKDYPKWAKLDAGQGRIEDAYRRGGGSSTHLPATATRRGDKDNAEGPEGAGKGVGTAKFENSIQDQKPEPGPVGKAWNQAMHGSDKGK